MEKSTNALEKALADINDKMPRMPENGKKTLVEWLPWISVVFGALSLLATLGFWNAAHRVNQFADFANQINRVYGTGTVAKLNAFFWLALLTMLATGLLGVIAFNGLKARSKKRGWDLLFYSQIISVLSGLIAAIFTDYTYGSGIIGTLIGAAIGFYLLFQVRSHYK